MAKKVIVAVHGVGEQIRYATIQQVLSHFCQYHGDIASVPLGNFHIERSLTLNHSCDLQALAFAEVYWADIARTVVNRKFDLEDTEPWVQTIIGRIRRRRLTEFDKTYPLFEEVLGEMLQTLGVLAHLSSLAEKMGLFSFDLKRVLTDYLGDVQIVADFKCERQEIGRRFAELLEKVYDEDTTAEIYLVAHSEGTVVTLLGLLSALCSPENEWIKQVRGLMTLGSPIDTHLALWPELFAAFERPCPGLNSRTPIEWRNYYDYGDPIGCELDAACEKFTEGSWTGVFNLEDCGFTRYFFPGKAHVDYWQDERVFGHFIQTVVYKNEKLMPKDVRKSFEEKPQTMWRAKIVSGVTPYLGAVALLFFAVLVLRQAALAYEGVYQLFEYTLADVGGYTVLLAGLTVAARIPRLTQERQWQVFGYLVFALSLLAYPAFPWLANPVAGRFLTDYQCQLGHLSDHYDLLGGAVLVLLFASFVLRKKLPAWGMRTLLVPGAIAIAYVIFGDVPAPRGAAWPVLLAEAFFLYVWWLVALVFDLIFFWHRYIWHSKEGQFLRGLNSSEGKAPSPVAPVLPTAAAK